MATPKSVTGESKKPPSFGRGLTRCCLALVMCIVLL